MLRQLQYKQTLTTSIEALKEEADAALKMFKIYDSTAVDPSDDEDNMDYLSESSGGEADWRFFGEASNVIKVSNVMKAPLSAFIFSFARLHNGRMLNYKKLLT